MISITPNYAAQHTHQFHYCYLNLFSWILKLHICTVKFVLLVIDQLHWLLNIWVAIDGCPLAILRSLNPAILWSNPNILLMLPVFELHRGSRKLLLALRNSPDIRMASLKLFGFFVLLQFVSSVLQVIVGDSRNVLLRLWMILLTKVALWGEW